MGDPEEASGRLSLMGSYSCGLLGAASLFRLDHTLLWV